MADEDRTGVAAARRDGEDDTDGEDDADGEGETDAEADADGDGAAASEGEADGEGEGEGEAATTVPQPAKAARASPIIHTWGVRIAATPSASSEPHDGEHYGRTRDPC